MASGHRQIVMCRHKTMIIKRWPSRIQPFHAEGNDLLLEY